MDKGTSTRVQGPSVRSVAVAAFGNRIIEYVKKVLIRGSLKIHLQVKMSYWSIDLKSLILMYWYVITWVSMRELD